MENINKFAPVIIPTLNRYDHFHRLVESLSKSPEAKETELVIGLDYPPSEKYMDGFCKIRDYIPTITGFRKVTVFVITLINRGMIVRFLPKMIMNFLQIS